MLDYNKYKHRTHIQYIDFDTITYQLSNCWHIQLLHIWLWETNAAYPASAFDLLCLFWCHRTSFNFCCFKISYFTLVVLYSKLSAYSFYCMNNYHASSHQTDMLHVPCDVSFQHTLTSTADLVLDRLTQRVSALTVGSDLESAKAQNTQEMDHPAKKEDCVTPTPSN